MAADPGVSDPGLRSLDLWTAGLERDRVDIDSDLRPGRSDRTLEEVGPRATAATLAKRLRGQALGLRGPLERARPTPRSVGALAVGATIALLTLTACGNDETSGEAPPPEPPPTADQASPSSPSGADASTEAEEDDAEQLDLTDDSESAPAGPTPLDLGPLQPGDYETIGFTPRFSFTVSDSGWTADFDDSDIFQIVRAALDGFLSISRGGGVIEPGPEPRPAPLPPNVVDWLAEHPDLDAGAATPTQVDGFDAVTIDVAATADTQLFIRTRGDPGVTVGTQQPNSVTYGLGQGMRARFTLLEINGDTIVISIDGEPDQWEEYLAVAQPVVGSLAFQVDD